MTRGFFSKFFGKSAAEPQNPKNSQTATEHERRLIELCSMPASEALAWLFSDPRGLTAEAAERRLHEVGPNELAHTKELSFLADIFERCKSPLVIQLLLIAAISAFIGEFKSTVIVGLMVLLPWAFLRPDRRSSNTVEASARAIADHGPARRRSRDRPVGHRAGDVVHLTQADIPADAITTAKDFVSQSAYRRVHGC
jgi:Mg2+-importing ATPase